MVNILIAPDKFKGSLSAHEVCTAIKEGILEKKSDAVITTIPLADGGEGTADLLTFYANGSVISKTVAGPLWAPVNADYGLSQNGKTAFVEMAKASGLILLKADDRNPLYTTTYGTGELIKDALDRGVHRIILCIGGSATNDAGAGMAAALGYEFIDHAGQSLSPIGENLKNLNTIKTDCAHPRLKEVEFITLCDVTNPLFGPQGAAFIYGPQKGADEKAIRILDDGLRNFAHIAERKFNFSLNFPGAGAAGGLGAGAKTFLNSILQTGMSFIAHTTQLEQRIIQADVIFTGEGKIDQQTLSGKVVAEVGKTALRHGKPVIAICGKSELTHHELEAIGIQKTVPLVDNTVSEALALQQAYSIIKAKAATCALAL